MVNKYFEDKPCMFKYINVQGGIRVVGYEGAKGFVKIPCEIDGKPVVEIGVAKDYGSGFSAEILIPATVKTIYAQAINSDNKLGWYDTYKNHNKGWIADFSLESGNTNLAIENNLLIENGKRVIYCIDRDAESIVVPDGVEIIGKCAFKNCKKLSEVVLPDSIRIIEDFAFEGCLIKKISLPEGLESIGFSAFRNNFVDRSIRTVFDVEIPSSLKYLSVNFDVNFLNIEQSGNFIITDDFLLTSDGKTLLGYLGKSVEELVIPDSVEVIAPYACSQSLSELKKLTLGASLKYISENAFRDNKVKTLRIPASLEDISDTAFDFSSITSVVINKANCRFFSDKTALYRKTENGNLELIYCFNNKIEEYAVADNTVRILSGAFVKCNNLIRLILPDSLKEFSEDVLKENKICLNKSRDDSKINICISQGAPEIHINYDSEFHYEISPDNPKFFWDNHVLYQRTDDGLIAVNSDAEFDELTLLDGTVSVATYAFRKRIGKLNLPSSVKRVETSAFEPCRINEVNLNEGLEFIGSYAFSGNNIKEIMLPASLKHIDNSAFWGCPFEKYMISDSSTEYAVENDALYSKDFSVLYDVPNYKNCDEFSVNENTKEIGIAFKKCNGIKAIRIPSGVKTLWNFAFDVQDALKDIYFEGSLECVCDRTFVWFRDLTLHTKSDPYLTQMIEKGYLRNSVSCKIILKSEEIDRLYQECSDFVLSINPTGLTILKNRSEKTDLVVPEKIGDYKVTAVAPHAFSEAGHSTNSLKTLVLPDTIESIGKGAFFFCENLKSITLPQGIKEIPESAFEFCKSLQILIIPDGVVRINDCAFYGCENITIISFPPSVQYISENVFASYSKSEMKYYYKDLNLNSKTTYIAEKDSYAEKFLKEYKPDKFNCNHLNVINKIPTISTESEEDNSEYIGIFEYVLTDDGTVSVSMNKYLSDEITEIKIPETIKGMPVTKLTGVSSLSANLESIYIHSGIESIEGFNEFTFSSCYTSFKMKNLYVSEDNQNYWSDGKALYTKDKSVLIHMFNCQTESYTVNKDTKIIESNAFSNFDKLKKLTLPDGLQEIKKSAFKNCSKLAEIVGIEKVKISSGTLFSTAFYKTAPIIVIGTTFVRFNALEKNFVIPDGITRIDNNAFLCDKNNDSLTEVVIPGSVKVIGDRAFKGRKNLSKVTISEGVESIGNDAFEGCDSLSEIEIPSSVIELGANAFPSYKTDWKGNLSSSSFSAVNVSPENEVFKSVDGILYSKDEKTLIKVPVNCNIKEFRAGELLETIGESAFAGNNHIQRVVLTPNVKTISSKAFSDCYSLEEINLENVAEIESDAFSDCKKLREADISATHIKPHSFEGCESLSSVTLRNTKTIDEYAFYQCKTLTDITLPEGLIAIGNHAFEDCGLSKVVVPKTVLDVGYECFSGCPEIIIYDTIDPNAAPCENGMDECNGNPNSKVGYIGIGHSWAMWTCAANHKWLDYEITVRSAETDEIRYKVWMGADPDQRKYYCRLASSWGKNATFNFAAQDEFFSKISGANHKLKVALTRLRYPENLSNKHREMYVDYLVRTAKNVITQCIDNDDMETLVFCEPFGIIKKTNVDSMIEYAVEVGAIKFSAYLMDYKDNHFGKSSRSGGPSFRL